ncbi:MAG TPA: uroporphyrinogen-III synthase, partial [Acidobacteriota bacterium]|nr:uroporphyrinogen-III synthase [Acidobacteriota bacterium]
SSSTVHHFMEMAGDLLSLLDPQKTRIAAIGPITAATLHDYGLTVAVEAEEFTIPGLVDAIARS